MSQRSMEERALDLVEKNRIDHDNDAQVFDVHGFSGREYFVVVRDRMAISCNCPAGAFGGPKCYHRMGVEAFLQMREMEVSGEDEDPEDWYYKS